MNFITTPLPPKVLEHPSRDRWVLINRVVSFDPSHVYKNAAPFLDPYQRVQSGLGMGHLWPALPGHCGCGCGLILTGRRTRWGSELCSDFANNVFSIIYGKAPVIMTYISRYHGEQCAKCGKTREELWEKIRARNEWTAPLFLDHIVPVKHGGGASWLSNYQLLCEKCHRAKTNEDFGWKKPPQARFDFPYQLTLI